MGKAQGGIIGLQSGTEMTKGPQMAMIGEAGAEAVVPLEGANKKYGRNILQQIIPKYFPDLAFMQQGSIGDAMDNKWRGDSGDRIPDFNKLLGTGGLLGKILDVLNRIHSSLLAWGAPLGTILGQPFYPKDIVGGPVKAEPIPVDPAPVNSVLVSIKTVLDGLLSYIPVLNETVLSINTSLEGLSTTMDKIGETFKVDVTVSTENFKVIMDESLRSFDSTVVGFKSGLDILISLIKGAGSIFYDDVKDSSKIFGDNLKSVFDKFITSMDSLIKRISNLSLSLASRGHQRGGIFSQPTVGMFGEAGAEALIPLSGKNKKYGRNLLEQILPKYYPDMVGFQTGGLFTGGGSTSNTYNSDSYSINGPINVTTNNPQDFMEQLKYQYRGSRRR